MFENIVTIYVLPVYTSYVFFMHELTGQSNSFQFLILLKSPRVYLSFILFKTIIPYNVGVNSGFSNVYLSFKE